MNRARRVLHAQIQAETIAGVFACLGLLVTYAVIALVMRVVLALGWYVGA
ncbi:MAG: hypothetical protein QME72_06020 [Rhodococcus sp. (in: high G+C Gram-positive bacteria)]|nr:hypothetical protein [Rhodococcus sp. (in: high G+C Gram-positive bacteria)]MDI6627259.1 hypothetical protein [Rhodococcus sp. (in: high G+C Gram-positive bacteria)]